MSRFVPEIASRSINRALLPALALSVPWLTIALASLLMEALLQGHAHEAYIPAFRWTVLLLGVVTATASWVFSRLQKDDRPSRATRTTD